MKKLSLALVSTFAGLASTAAMADDWSNYLYCVGYEGNKVHVVDLSLHLKTREIFGSISTYNKGENGKLGTYIRGTNERIYTVSDSEDGPMTAIFKAEDGKAAFTFEQGPAIFSDGSLDGTVTSGSYIVESSLKGASGTVTLPALTCMEKPE